MKAISRLLIVALLFVGTTGFGLTTADLSQNSEPDIVMHDSVDAISVIVVDSNLDVEIMSYEAMTLSDNSESNLFFVERFENVLSYVDDVGWQLPDRTIDSKSYNVNPRNQNKVFNRNPRDGITC